MASNSMKVSTARSLQAQCAVHVSKHAGRRSWRGSLRSAGRRPHANTPPCPRAAAGAGAGDAPTEVDAKLGVGSPYVTRRQLVGGLAAAGGLCISPETSSAALWSEPERIFVDSVQGSVAATMSGLGNKGNKKLEAAFMKAYAVQDDPVALEQAWSDCIAIAPTNASVWSNRGVARLALKRYAEAKADLEKARDLEAAAFGYPTAVVLVPLGNTKGALGDWEGAIGDYQEALLDPSGIPSIALARMSLAKFEFGQPDAAVKLAKEALADDPALMDTKSAMAGMLWALGNKDAAQEACKAAGGAAALRAMVDAQQTGGDYNTWILPAHWLKWGSKATNGWPPRTIAAVNAFLSSSDSGTATDYAGVSKAYTF